ncbi:helix-turn-helix transcriptional regulator [Kibdelosporangium persicum]|uniref:Transcriptional regulator n=1 Tax=Kibdelosporangium persicum TaxID=2698649 RepID=A0ABX2FDP6_9PSEU|nr:helix-turn-helix transcriptional regulator [Kibdelosporangium persicum]NRN69254.1 Transcriptional regulator [Kibdelosporangium persicum]
MTEPSRSTFLRRKLGAKLKRMREQAKMSLDDAAPRLDKTRSTLHRIEKGETRADVHLIRSMMDVYDIFDADLVEEARAAAKTPWYRAYGFKDLGYVDVETEAARVREFQPVDISGLLQTPAYMRALFDAYHRGGPLTMENDLKVRSIRRRRLTSKDRPLQLTSLIYEAALHREVGGAEVMREQLRHLVEVSELPTVTLQIVPLKALYVPNGVFTLLGFEDPADPEMLYVEYPTGSLHIEDESEVHEAKLVFEQVHAKSLSPTDSVALIERLIS